MFEGACFLRKSAWLNQIRQTGPSEVLHRAAVPAGGRMGLILRQRLSMWWLRGKVRITVKQRFALKDAADAHKAWKRAQLRAPPF